MPQSHGPCRLLALALALASPTLAVPAEVVAVRADRLLDVAAQQVRGPAFVVVEAGRIKEIAAVAPAGARVIDLGRRTLLPGFIDAHAHVLIQGDATDEEYDDQILKESTVYRALRATKAMRIALEHGFTTLRDIGNEGTGFADVDLRRAEAAGSSSGPGSSSPPRPWPPPGPTASPATPGSSTVPKGVELCDGADGCRKAVRDQIAKGADWIKVYADRGYFKQPDGQIRSLPNFTDEEMRAIVDQAHRTRRKVAAHTITPSGHAIALAAGVDTIEHGDVLDDATIRTMAEKKVYLCPTLTVMDYVAAPRSKTNPIWNELLKTSAESFKKALKAGVPIALGSDAGGFHWEEINNAEEFKRYVDLGMTPWQALRSGTVTAAALLGQERELGTLAVGARADLVARRRSAEGHHRHRAGLLRDEGGCGGEGRAVTPRP